MCLVLNKVNYMTKKSKKALQHTPVAGDLAVDDPLGVVIDHSWLSLINNGGIGCVIIVISGI